MSWSDWLLDISYHWCNIRGHCLFGWLRWPENLSSVGVISVFGILLDNNQMRTFSHTSICLLRWRVITSHTHVSTPTTTIQAHWRVPGSEPLHCPAKGSRAYIIRAYAFSRAGANLGQPSSHRSYRISTIIPIPSLVSSIELIAPLRRQLRWTSALLLSSSYPNSRREARVDAISGENQLEKNYRRCTRTS